MVYFFCFTSLFVMFHFQSAHCNTPPTDMLQQLLQSLATPPKLTTVRVNSLKYDRETVIAMLRELLDKVVLKMCLSLIVCKKLDRTALLL